VGGERSLADLTVNREVAPFSDQASKVSLGATAGVGGSQLHRQLGADSGRSPDRNGNAILDP
jgi:hypothetical protein